MKIVTTTAVFPKGYDVIRATERIAKIGFDALDLAFDYCNTPDCPFTGANADAWIRQLREQAERLGIRFTHAHAGFDAWAQGELVPHTMRCAAALGIRYLVVHPAWCSPEGQVYEDPEEFIAVNHRQYARILETAAAHGLTILTENLLWGASIAPENISELVNRIQSPNFGWCYDAGHANCFGIRPAALRTLACPPVSLHIHDNAGALDNHLLPGDGTVDWEEFLQVLSDIGYAGEFVLEAHHQSIEAPDDRRDEILLELLRRSKKMVDKMNTLHG